MHLDDTHLEVINFVSWASFPRAVGQPVTHLVRVFGVEPLGELDPASTLAIEGPKVHRLSVRVDRVRDVWTRDEFDAKVNEWVFQIRVEQPCSWGSQGKSTWPRSRAEKLGGVIVACRVTAVAFIEIPAGVDVVQHLVVLRF